jgi:hypothetical protein
MRDSPSPAPPQEIFWRSIPATAKRSGMRAQARKSKALPSPANSMATKIHLQRRHPVRLGPAAIAVKANGIVLRHCVQRLYRFGLHRRDYVLYHIIHFHHPEIFVIENVAVHHEAAGKILVGGVDVDGICPIPWRY